MVHLNGSEFTINKSKYPPLIFLHSITSLDLSFEFHLQPFTFWIKLLHFTFLLNFCVIAFCKTRRHKNISKNLFTFITGCGILQNSSLSRCNIKLDYRKLHLECNFNWNFWRNCIFHLTYSPSSEQIRTK